jgi:hypothetical protein
VATPEPLIGRDATGVLNEAPTSAVSWPAIIAGAAVAAATSLILIALGSGFGLASVSSLPGSGTTARTFTTIGAIWLIVVQWLASGIGGYIAGRMRTKWVAIHTHEVFFRDTANGFVTWAVATAIVTFVFASSISSVVGASARATANAGAAGIQGALDTAQSLTADLRYNADVLVRPSNAQTEVATGEVRAEISNILARVVSTGELAASDRSYVAQLVAQRTGISQADAAKRVDAAVANIKAADARTRELLEDARKAAARASIYTGLSMLIGAFIACVAAALGGRRRDEHP